LANAKVFIMVLLGVRDPEEIKNLSKFEKSFASVLKNDYQE
jgi:hypothetical protein